MACSKYTLTNTGTTVVNFSYRRCEDSMWDYQVELLPNQLKNIWVINGTYTVAPSFKNIISFVDNGPFPPISATNTPTPTPSLTPSNTPTSTAAVTPTPTPSVTATNTPTVTPTGTAEVTPTPTGTAGVTPTPSVTATNTPTPTEPVRYNQPDICHDQTNEQNACDCLSTANLFTDGVDMASSSFAFSDATGPNTGNPEGYYVQGGILYLVATGCGPGCGAGSAITVVGPCGVTPTPTPTNTETPTNTPTPTVTPTSPLQSFSVFSGTTSNEACENGTSLTIYASDPLFDQNSEFYNDPTGVVTTDMTGFFSDGTSVVQLDSNGVLVGSFISCSGLVTPTPTPTETSTPTPTPTQTQTPTQTFAWYTYSLGTGTTANEACAAFVSSPQTIYGTVEGGVGPNIGEFLYETEGRPLTNAVPNGFYSNGTAWFQVTGGLGEVTSSTPNGCNNLPTPTPTPTNTSTVTNTPTVTPSPTTTLTSTPTQTPTPSVTPEVYNLILTNSATTNASIAFFFDSVSDPIPLTNATQSLPVTSGQTLSADFGPTSTGVNIGVTGSGTINFEIIINGITQQTSSATETVTIGVNSDVPLSASDVLEFTITN